MNDVYQDRYISHQEKKKRQLMFSEGEEKKDLPKSFIQSTEQLLKYRRSQRLFNNKPIEEKDLIKILDAATYAPNSCNRHGIKLKVVTDRTDKSLLNGILVGGVGWVYRADIVILFIADQEAYKSPNEKDFMHFCDVGFTAMNMWLTAESLNVGACYINPNIMPVNKSIFENRFGKGIFCGALALGNYDVRVKKADQPKREEITML